MPTQTGFPPEILYDDKIQILLVISSREISQISQKFLQRPGLLLVTLAETGIQALEIAKTKIFDVIISDYDLQDMDAISFHMQLQNMGVNIPFLIFNVTDRDRAILEEYGKDSSQKGVNEHDISIIFTEQAQKIIQSVELFRTRNRLEIYSRHLEELVEKRTRELQIAQRFAVIGELATMIGHDMRNPLQVITNTHYLLTTKIRTMTSQEVSILAKYKIPELFDRIDSETQYLNKIVSNLQDYARDVYPERIFLNPGNSIDEILSSLQIQESILIKKEYEPEIMISFDPVLFTRVMENLIMNAIQAMEKGGNLLLVTKHSMGNVDIIISDTGGGIPPGSEERIFEPLFTTKSKGTGLGLSVTKRLIEAHEGTITLKETSPKGTTFVVTLPAINKTQVE